MLASVTEEEVRTTFAEKDVGVFMVFFRHNMTGTPLLERVARALLKQIVRMKLNIPEDLEKSAEKHYYGPETTFELSAILNVLNNHLPNFSKPSLFLMTWTRSPMKLLAKLSQTFIRLRRERPLTIMKAEHAIGLAVGRNELSPHEIIPGTHLSLGVPV